MMKIKGSVSNQSTNYKLENGFKNHNMIGFVSSNLLYQVTNTDFIELNYKIEVPAFHAKQDY